MSKMSRFIGPFDKQHSKWAQTPLKSERQHLYYMYWSLLRQLSWKKSVLLICQILELLLNTLAVNDKYPVLNRDNLMMPVEIHLSQKQKTFSQFFSAFLNSSSNLNVLKEKMTLIDFLFPKLWAPKTSLDKCIKSPVSDDPLTSNMLNGPKHCWNLQHTTLIIFVDHC